MIRAKLLIAGLLICTFAEAQKKRRKASTQPEYTVAESRFEGFQRRKQLLNSSLIKNVAFRNVGPTVMSGRIVDFEVDPEDPTHFYAAFASGGLWETKNQGASFVPIFDDQIVMSIGDTAVDWTHNII